MGTRYFCQFRCSYCNTLNDDVWYAPSCGYFTFHCEKCGKENGINMDFHAVKIEDFADPEWLEQQEYIKSLANG